MAVHVPAKLKAADLTRFIVRASQLESAKPVIAYWCEYWIVNQILAKGLHNGDAETLEYTTTLMDKLEQIKADNAGNDAIIDDVAGQAYVEQFALETFQRADRAVQADKVTKQTADTFQAASTFFELINIWAAPDAETLAKIKYSKWNAVRIVRALKEGKDPNESNPKPEPTPEESLPALDPDDPEVQGFGKPTRPRQASVEDVPDEADQIEARLARQSSIDKSLHPSARGSPGVGGSPAFDPYPRDGFPYTATQDDNVSPLESSPHARIGSVGGGYFPEVPTFTSEVRDSTLPTAPLDDVLDLGLPDQPSNAPGTKPSVDLESFPPPTMSDQSSPPSPPEFYRPGPPQVPSHSPPPQQHYPPPPVPTFHQAPPPQQFNPVPSPKPATVPVAVQPRTNKLNTDDISVAKAQKHARWAISALNFEDADTAVKELRAALQTLGAV
ncbi:Vacuolar protein sorting-associated protein [Lachnellula subtilissima]|uniref:Vacuolar protein sorting-associated protein n=1 Tax=Lachnellula subtilissima TaxID=602034 RepID=A0A8H8U6V9_9HELO|nr:Vacuolar protein sorting-associated protein [Lachnellula subtilissima]